MTDTVESIRQRNEAYRATMNEWDALQRIEEASADVATLLGIIDQLNEQFVGTVVRSVAVSETGVSPSSGNLAPHTKWARNVEPVLLIGGPSRSLEGHLKALRALAKSRGVKV